jgi:glutamate-1-semialdehyde 2,1-aminomutase
VAAGLAMLRHIQANPGIYDDLNRVTGRIAACAPENISVNRVGSMMTWFFTPEPVNDYTSAKRCDTKQFARFFHAMLERGIYLPPSQFEAFFVSTAHTDADIERTICAAKESFQVALS